MKKKLLTLALCVIAICFSLSIVFSAGVTFASAAESTNTESKLFEYYENINRSVAVYNNAISPYKSIAKDLNGEENVTYSDDFAGVFIDDEGLLNIGLVGSIQSASRFNGQVKYKQCEFTYNYLQDIQDVITNAKADYSIYMTAVSEKNNNLCIYLNDESDIKRITDFLQQRYEFDVRAINFVIEGTGGIVKNTSAYGGESIYSWTSSTTVSRGTICVDVIDNATGQFGVLTNEHVALANEGSPDMVYGGHATIYGGSVNFSENLDLGNAARGQHSGTIDAAFVPYANQQYWENTPYGRYNTNSYTNVRLGNSNQIIEGQSIRKIGQTTGVTDGTITHTNASVQINYGTEADPDWETITNSIIYSNSSLGGDSGGPVYYNDGTNLWLIGMHYGGSATSGAGCRIQNVMSTLNVTPITNDNFNSLQYSVTLNKQGGTGGANSVTATYNSAMPLLTNVATEQTGANEFLRYMNVASIFDTYGLVPYTISFDIKSPVAGEVLVYQQNGSGAKYAFPWRTVNATTTYTRQYITVTPTVANSSLTESWLAFYGTYGTGRIVSIKNVKIELGSTASPWNSNMIIPQKTGYSFNGYWSGTNGGTQYYNSIMSSAHNWNIARAATLYARWIANQYTVTFDKQGGTGGTSSVSATYNSSMPSATAPTRTGYIFDGYWTGTNGTGTKYYNANMTSARTWNLTSSASTLYAKWIPKTYTIVVFYSFFQHQAQEYVWPINEVTYTVYWDQGFTYTAPSTWGPPNYSAQNFEGFAVSKNLSQIPSLSTNYYTTNGTTITFYTTNSDLIGQTIYVGATYYTAPSCIAEDTMITLADGSQVAVEDLTGDELLLVWNLQTGTFDVAPILFIDSDPYTQYEIIQLYFSDGTEVKVISEHGFWDIDLNMYVFLNSDAGQYVGHWFYKQAEDVNENMIAVQLVDVDTYNEYTTAWSPVTYGHLCYYVNGMLSMPGATEGLINIFEVDSTTMQYDQEAFQADIQTYGLFTYEEFSEIIPIPEVIFEAFNGQYLKVSIGKGLITLDGLITLIERYAVFFTEEDDNTPDVQDDKNSHGNHNGQGNGNNNGYGNGNHNGHGNGSGNHNGHRRRGR